MRRLISIRQVLALLVFFALTMLSGFPSAAQDSATPEPGAPAQATFGSGSFNLLTPTVGLSDLANYRATLTLSFDGTNAGQPQQWSHTYAMLVTQSHAARQLTIDPSEDAAAQVYMAEVNDTHYERHGADACIASAIQTPSAFAQQWEPAALLDSVIGAEEAGTDTINDATTNHYTFDERAQGAAGLAKSTGDLWMAADGNYLVRLKLVTTGGAGYFGDGIEGKVTWDYELDEVNQSLTIAIPKDCPTGILDTPVMEDATDVVRVPGFTSYTTSSGLEDVVAFYQQRLSASGAQLANPPVSTDNLALLSFTQGSQAILVTVSIDTDASNTVVELQSTNDPAELAFAAEVPDTASTQAVETPQDPTQECPATVGAIPMLPDASNVVTMPGMTSYTTPTSVADAVTFYKQQLSALGAQIITEPSPSDQMAMLNITQAGQTMSVTIASQGGSTTVAIMGAMNPVAPANGCSASQSALPQPTAAPELASTQVGTVPGNSSAACSVSAAGNVNERTGPGTSFARAGTLVGGTSATVDGQATGTDGQIWWRLGEGVWVRSDVVNEAGACDSVPFVQS